MQKHLLNSANLLTNDLIAKINAAYQEAERAIVAAFAKAPQADIVFALAPEWTIPNTGFGGRTFSPHLLLIALNPAEEIKQADLKYTLCHEINHLIRVQALGERAFFSGSTLMDGIVAEGLAELFEVEVGRKVATTFNPQITEKQLRAGLKQALAIGSGDYDLDEWFFCEDGRRPHWFAYNLGIYLIQKYCRQYQLQPSQITLLPTSKFVEFLKKEIN